MEHLVTKYQDGQVILFDKPVGWTSFDVVKKVKLQLKNRLRIKKIRVGHAGTLDPLASGLLIVCTGKYTKQITNIQDQEKTYSGSIFLGASRPSYDLETEIDQTFDISHINNDMIEEKLSLFRGEIKQMPPKFSALKVNGRKAYDLARKGLDVSLKERLVQIHEFTCKYDEFPEIDFFVRCSKGTYIRSLAHDLGQALDAGAYLRSLRREAIGKYSVNDAISPEVFDVMEEYDFQL